MKLLRRLIVSVLIGDCLYAAILFVAFRFPSIVTRAPFLLWNLRAFAFLGRGAPIGYSPSGEPIYNGTEGILFTSWENVLLGFLLYPLIIFGLLMVVSSIKNRNN